MTRLAYGDALASEARGDGHVPVVGSGGVSGTHDKNNFSAPGIVVGRKGSYGSVHWVPSGGFAIDTAYYIDEGLTSVYLRWLYYVLQAVDLRGPSQDVGVPGLSREAAYAVLVPAPPPLEEQHRIADFLDAETARIDKLVALRDRQIRLVQERRASSLNHAFKRETHSATRLKHLLATRPRYGVLVPQFVEGDGVRFIRVNDLLDLSGRANSLRRIPHTLSSQYARTITRPGDVLLSVVGTMGRSAIVPPELEGANVARAVASLRPATDVSAELVAAWLTTPDFIRQAVIATSSDTAQPTLGMEDLANFRLSWPSSPSAQRDLLHEVRAIQRHGNRLVRAFQAQSRLLAERRQALITAAVTGQFDATTASGRNVTEGVSA
ncbi:hypothetical protein [Streptomyces pseudogriseolus]|uniref:hypothetical protein n=1 Tax=Streptomyces pseudogriseolus TaxID=36817 RepID=UPI003FA339FA